MTLQHVTPLNHFTTNRPATHRYYHLAEYLSAKTEYLKCKTRMHLGGSKCSPHYNVILKTT